MSRGSPLLHKFIHLLMLAALMLVLLMPLAKIPPKTVFADGAYHNLAGGNFTQDWTNLALITANDDWSGVASINGFRGDSLTAATGTDPQTIVADETTLDVNANQTNPDTFATGGVTEFHIANPTVALTGSGTADAPFIVIQLNSTGRSSLNITYNVRDLDASVDDAVQQVALQYRVGAAGNFTNLPGGYIADATTGGAATQVTPVNVILPASADNQSQVQIRIMTTNAIGNDEWVGIDDIVVSSAPFAGDIAPTVSSTTPTNGAVGVALTDNITVNFSEAVNVAGAWFTISCATSGAHTAVVSGASPAFTLNPDIDFSAGETCTVTVLAAQVTDQDATDPPDNMAADHVFSFTTAGGACPAATITPIGAIQTAGLSGAAGAYTIRGTVVGDFQGASGLNGFYVQNDVAGSDGNPATSDGIFINSNTAVNLGDSVQVAGTQAEGFGETRLNGATVTVCAGSGAITPTPITLPFADATGFEPFEGMLVTFPQTLTVTSTHNLGRFGEVWVAFGSRLSQPTNIATPGAAANAVQTANDGRMFILDDGSSLQNLNPSAYPNAVAQPPGLTANNSIRGGDAVTNVTGVLGFGFSEYRLQPNPAPNPIPLFASQNPRPATPPDVGGLVEVASFNVLNYFSTLDAGTAICGPLADQFCRGADSASEFTRQRDKIINAICAINPDVAGLMEIENNTSASLQDLINGLNAQAGCGPYAFINTGTIGGDAIKVALIYKPATITPVGAHAVLDNVDPFNRNSRPPLAQTFQSVVNSEIFTVVVNHFKSKTPPSPDILSPDSNANLGDGQGYFNADRVLAAQQMVAWLATSPTGTADPDILIIGDLNAYAREDPITYLEGQGFVNLIRAAHGDSAYSYSFDGQWGYLDHALANASMEAFVTGVEDWHINADEVAYLDYNVEFKTGNHPTSLYDPAPFRVSDHDPVIIGLFEAPVAPPPPGGAAAPGTTTTVPDSNFISKSADKSLAALGDTITYTITFNNPKGINLRQVVISDVLDSRFENVRVVSNTLGTASVSGNTVTVQGFELLPGQRVTLVISASISSRARPGDVITNTATLESPDASIHVSNAVQVTILPGSLPSTGERSRSNLWFVLPIMLGLAGMLVYRRKFRLAR